MGRGSLGGSFRGAWSSWCVVFRVRVYRILGLRGGGSSGRVCSRAVAWRTGFVEAAVFVSGTVLFIGRRYSLHEFDAIKEEIRSRVELVELVSEQTALQRRGRTFLGLCPFHEEKTPSFNVNQEEQYFKCFGCGVAGDLFTFIQLRESVDFSESLQILADKAGVELRRSSGRELSDYGSSDRGLSDGGAPHRGVAGGGRGVADGGRGTSKRADIAAVNLWAVTYFRNLLGSDVGLKSREYLAGRGVSDEMVERFGLGLAIGPGDGLMRAARSAGFSEQLLLDAGVIKQGERGGCYDTFRERIMFPIHDAMKRCIAFGGRTIVDAPAKYLNSPQTLLFDKSKSLYGLDLARESISELNEAILVEGYTDCIAAHQHGFTNTVATLGTAATDSQMASLRRFCGGIVLVFDSDAAGEAATDRALAVALRHNLGVKLTRVPDGKDPCEFLQSYGTQGFREVLNSSVDALTFKWNRTRLAYNGATTPGEKHRVVDAFVSLVADLAQFRALDAIQQGMMVGQLSHLLSVPAGRVQSLLLEKAKAGRNRQSRHAGRSGYMGQAGRVGRVGQAGHVESSASGVSDVEGLAAGSVFSGDFSSWVRPRSGVQGALTTVLEVLLVEPGLFEQVSDYVVSDRYEDAVLAEIAVQVRTLWEAYGEFRFSELLSRLTDPLHASVATELHVSGLRYGGGSGSGGSDGSDLEATLSGALGKLKQLDVDAETRGLVDAMKRGDASCPVDAAHVSALTDRLRAGSFAPRRAMNEYSGWTDVS